MVHKKWVTRATIIVAFVTLMLLFLPTQIALAYSIRANRTSQVVQLYWQPNERQTLISRPGTAANQVIAAAKSAGIPIKRSKGSIEGEIRAHALAGYNSQTNPMDIEMYSAPWWSYLLD